MMYTLNPGLTRWAFDLTRTISLPDSDGMKQSRARYHGYAPAQKPPSVMMGDTISGETFWVGKLMNRWAERWVRYWTDNQGVMATTAEEDVAFCQALALQAKAGRVDPERASCFVPRAISTCLHRGRPPHSFLLMKRMKKAIQPSFHRSTLPIRLVASSCANLLRIGTGMRTPSLLLANRAHSALPHSPLKGP